MKIGIFLNNYHNITGRAYKETMTLSRAGHEVVVLARHSKDLKKEEIIGGAKVLRLVVWPETSIPGLKQLIFSYRWIREGLKLDVDVYQVADADTLLEAAVCAVLKRKKLVYDSYELFLNIASLENKKISRFYWWIKEWLGVRASDCVISANSERAEIMKKRYPFIKKMEAIENFPNKIILQGDSYEKSREEMRKKLGVEDKTVFVFQGYLNKNRGLEDLYEALPYCKKLDQAVFLIVGDGNYRETFENKIKEKKYGNFIFTGRVDYLELPRYISSGDVGLVFYPPICLNYIYAAPNKLYEYMMNNLAVLSNNIVTIRKVIEREGCGICYENGAKNLAEKIDWLVKNGEKVSEMKKNGLDSAMLKYNWECQEEEFLNIYNNL